jgi:hypothetical protein
MQMGDSTRAEGTNRNPFGDSGFRKCFRVRCRETVPDAAHTFLQSRGFVALCKGLEQVTQVQ